MPHCIRTNSQLSVEQIQQKVDRYQDYVLSKISTGEPVYLSNVFERADLEAILASDCDGIRVMLVKEENPEELDKEQGKVGLLVVPVQKVNTDSGKDDTSTFLFKNLLNDTNSVIYDPCPSKYCDSSVIRRSLI